MIHLHSKRLLGEVKKKIVASTVLSFYSDGSGFLWSGEVKKFNFKKGTFYKFTLLSISNLQSCILGNSFSLHQVVFGSFMDDNGNLYPALPGEVSNDIVYALDIQPGVIGEFAAADNFSTITQIANLGETSTMSLQIDELA